jgi:hypothetical protein
MPKTLADARIKLTALTTKPTAPAAMTAADLTGAGAVDIMCSINKADYKLGATGNSSVTEQEACKKGEGNAPGPATYEGSVTPFWYLDADGKLIEADNAVWDLLKEEGATVYMFEREGKNAADAWLAGDEYEYYEVILGTAQPPSDRFAGYIKRTVPLFVQDHQHGVVAAGA